MLFKIKRIDPLLNQEGFTLLELIIVIAIMGFVLTAGFAFMMFGNRAFQVTSKHAEQQFDVRMPLDFISKTVRYAEEVEILSTLPASFDADRNYIYIQNNQIKYREKNVEKVVPGVGAVNDYEFIVQKSNQNTLKIIVKKVGSESFNISTEVTVLNVGTTGITGANEGICISFTDDKVISGLPIEIASIEEKIVMSVPQYSIYSMPTEVNVSKSDGSHGKSEVTWNNVIDTSTIGLKTSEGIVKGYSAKKTKLEITVVPATIASIDDIAVSVNQGQAYSSPDTIPVVLVGGGIVNMPVVWTPDTIATITPGIYIVQGTVIGYTPQVNLILTVESLFATSAIISPNSTTVMKNASVTFPSTGTVTWSDGTQSAEIIVWTPGTPDTSALGEVTYTGTVGTTGLYVSFVVKVIKSKLPDPTNVKKTKSGNLYTISLSGEKGASVIFMDGSDQEAVGIIPASGVFSITGGKNEYKNVTKVFLRKVDWEDSNTVNVH